MSDNEFDCMFSWIIDYRGLHAGWLRKNYLLKLTDAQNTQYWAFSTDPQWRAVWPYLAHNLDVADIINNIIATLVCFTNFSLCLNNELNTAYSAHAWVSRNNFSQPTCKLQYKHEFKKLISSWISMIDIHCKMGMDEWFHEMVLYIAY